MSHAFGMNKDKIVRAKKRGVILRHKSSFVPSLTIANKLKGVRFVLSNIQYNSNLNEYEFKDINNMIHVDENGLLSSWRKRYTTSYKMNNARTKQ